MLIICFCLIYFLTHESFGKIPYLNIKFVDNFVTDMGIIYFL